MTEDCHLLSTSDERKQVFYLYMRKEAGGSLSKVLSKCRTTNADSVGRIERKRSALFDPQIREQLYQPKKMRQRLAEFKVIHKQTNGVSTKFVGDGNTILIVDPFKFRHRKPTLVADVLINASRRDYLDGRQA